MCNIRLHLEEISVVIPEIQGFIETHKDAFFDCQLNNNDQCCYELDQDNRLFKILNENGELIGFCLLNIKNEPNWRYGYGYDYELEIGIFNDFQECGYATECISNILYLLPSVNWNNANLFARIYERNPDKKDMENILYRCGFKRTDKIIGIVEYTKSLE